MVTNSYSHLTAKERESLSFPAKYLLNEELIKGRILDFGCGFGSDVEFLIKKGYEIEGYDKYYFKEYPKGKFDTILCFYVLNVLHIQEQSQVLMEISELLKPEGKAYFAVRRDIVHEGYRMHKVHQKPTFQCQVKLHLDSIFRNENCEIYKYRHFNQIHKDSSPCIFCTPSSKTELITESAMAYSILDKYPVTTGHTLIIPKRHISNYFELSFWEQSALWFMANRVKKVLLDRYRPDGFNVGVNVGQPAGQTVDHVHIHVIPRYQNDIDDPEGGIRSVIPEKRKYLK